MVILLQCIDSLQLDNNEPLNRLTVAFRTRFTHFGCACYFVFLLVTTNCMLCRQCSLRALRWVRVYRICETPRPSYFSKIRDPATDSAKIGQDSIFLIDHSPPLLKGGISKIGNLYKGRNLKENETTMNMKSDKGIMVGLILNHKAVTISEQ